MTEHTSIQPPEAGERRMSRRRQVLYLLIPYLILPFMLELGFRAALFIADDFSPYYLTFGFVPDVGYHSADYAGYTKFQPHTVYRYKASRTRTIAMGINGDGFRGLREFVKPAPPGTIRIVALGESSTFGLFNEDDETYPYLLEGRLRARFPNESIEVLNLGIPHYRTNNILALARAELAGLEPQLVTLYAGYNNSVLFRPPMQSGLAYQAKEWMKAHSVAYRTLHPLAAAAYQRIAGWLGKDLFDLPHLRLPVELTEQRVSMLRQLARREFREDLDSLAHTVADAGALLVLITQTYQLKEVPDAAFPLTHPHYRDQVTFVDSLLAANGHLPAPYVTLLIHHDLMEELRACGRDRGLPVVDGIAALDEDRVQYMASVVHLTGEGNARLSEAIEDALVDTGAFGRMRTTSTAQASSAVGTGRGTN